ncbi:hypothetical protein LZ30DRAFT_710525 [Colletotrichum cereale]|nr:hypothetical protein LZ30DRAFT_710525 [Colletotrichum cereale]
MAPSNSIKCSCRDFAKPLAPCVCTLHSHLDHARFVDPLAFRHSRIAMGTLRFPTPRCGCCGTADGVAQLTQCRCRKCGGGRSLSAHAAEWKKTSSGTLESERGSSCNLCQVGKEINVVDSHLKPGDRRTGSAPTTSGAAAESRTLEHNAPPQWLSPAHNDEGNDLGELPMREVLWPSPASRRSGLVFAPHLLPRLSMGSASSVPPSRPPIKDNNPNLACWPFQAGANEQSWLLLPRCNLAMPTYRRRILDPSAGMPSQPPSRMLTTTSVLSCVAAMANHRSLPPVVDLVNCSMMGIDYRPPTVPSRCLRACLYAAHPSYYRGSLLVRFGSDTPDVYSGIHIRALLCIADPKKTVRRQSAVYGQRTTH